MADIYFQVNLCFVRLAGVPLKVQKASQLNSAYNEILAVCYYCTYLSVTLDCLFKKQELHESMKNVRMIFGMAVVAMMHLYLRYRNYVCTNIYLHKFYDSLSPSTILEITSNFAFSKDNSFINSFIKYFLLVKSDMCVYNLAVHQHILA
jgi:hypothetical protein